MRDLAVVLVAAGSGTRLGFNTPKAFVNLAGITLLEHALKHTLAVEHLRQVIVVAPKSHLAEARAIAAANLKSGVTVDVVEGSTETRQGSIENGLKVLLSDIKLVLVHDAARSLTDRKSVV